MRIKDAIYSLKCTKETSVNSFHTDALDMAIKALEAQQWIPVEDIIDIPNHEVLCCDKYGEEMFGYLYYNEQWLCESDSTIMYYPIAYREKPEPYISDSNVGRKEGE